MYMCTLLSCIGLNNFPGCKMKRSRILALQFIDVFLPVERLLFPKGLIERSYRYICKVFQEEAIESYYADKQDIGFFESFILGSDETKRMAVETNKTIEVLRQVQLREKLAGYVRSNRANAIDETEVMKDNIVAKKKRFVETLIERDEVIKYLGRRIVTRDEKLYQKLERMYHKFSKALEERSK